MFDEKRHKFIAPFIIPFQIRLQADTHKGSQMFTLATRPGDEPNLGYIRLSLPNNAITKSHSPCLPHRKWLRPPSLVPSKVNFLFSIVYHSIGALLYLLNVL